MSKLYIGIERPSDLVIQTLRVLTKDIQFAELTDAQRHIAMALLNNKSGLVWEEGSSKLDYTVGLTDPGRSVLAAYDAGPGEQELKDTCVELVRVMLGKRPPMPESSWMDIAHRTIKALDAATDKAGEGG